MGPALAKFLDSFISHQALWASESQFLDPTHFVNFTYSFNPGTVFVQSNGEEFVADLEGGSPPSPDYALVSVIEGRALQSEGNGPVPWSVLQTEFVERTPGKNGSDEPSTKHALKPFVALPSLLQAHPSIDTVS